MRDNDSRQSVPCIRGNAVGDQYGDGMREGMKE